MKLKTDLVKGLKHSFSREKVFYTSTASIFSFLLLLTLSAPGSIMQSLRLGLGVLPETFNLILLANIQEGLFIPSIMYSVLLGAVAVNTVESLRSQKTSLKNSLAALPGIAAAGCGGCGVGLLAFLGFAGALSFLPLGGLEIYAAGILILGFSLARMGDPTVCDL